MPFLIFCLSADFILQSTMTNLNPALQIIMIRSRNIISLIRTFFQPSIFIYFSQSKQPFSYQAYENSSFNVNVLEFLTRISISHKQSPNTFRIRECPFCIKPHYDEATNLYTLNVNKKNGTYYCHRCSAKGNWNLLRAKYLNLDSEDQNQLKQLSNFPLQPQISELEMFFYTTNLENKQFIAIKQYLVGFGLTEETLKKYSVGAGVESFPSKSGGHLQIKSIFFPIFQLIKAKDQTIEKNLVKFKVKTTIKSKQNLAKFFPVSPKNGFFGLNTIRNQDRLVVLCDDEIGAMLINQQTGFPSISLPQGANSLFDQICAFLDQFEKVVLWLSNDEAGTLAEEKLSYKIGLDRTYIVRHTYKDIRSPKQFFQKRAKEMKSIIQKSKTNPGQNILRFNDFEDIIKNRILRQQQYSGVKINWFPFFNKKVKGIRTQEVSIVSGHTGCGKTTLLSQLTLELCRKSIPVLWGSFQIKNQILVTNMILQYSGINLFEKKQKFDYYSEQFKNFPFFWLNFSGSGDIENVLSSIEYSIEKNNISVVVLDTLQFLLSNQGEGYQKFIIQDKVLSRLRKMATNLNVHIIIVIHPRKTDDSEDIQLHSVYGTSKSTQEADNVWILQKRDNYRILEDEQVSQKKKKQNARTNLPIFEIKKNRFDGDIGKVALGYNKKNKSFFQLKREQISDLLTHQISMESIIDEREKLLGEERNWNEFNNELTAANEEKEKLDQV